MSNARAHDPLRHRHRDIHSAELFSSWLAKVIAAAKSEIVAVEMPPRLPDLAPIWVALTRRIRAGVKYTRIVGVDEIAEHGLDIVTRDMELYGIRLRIAPPELISEAYYLVDNRRLLLKNNRRLSGHEKTEHFGVYTTHHAIVRRYKERFSERYMRSSSDARIYIDRLRKTADRLCRQLRAEDRARHATLLNEIACLGKFAKIKDTDTNTVSQLLEQKLLVRNAAGHIVMTVEDA